MIEAFKSREDKDLRLTLEAFLRLMWAAGLLDAKYAFDYYLKLFLTCTEIPMMSQFEFELAMKQIATDRCKGDMAFLMLKHFKQARSCEPASTESKLFSMENVQVLAKYSTHLKLLFTKHLSVNWNAGKLIHTLEQVMAENTKLSLSALIKLL
jgi:hypothetical protein